MAAYKIAHFYILTLPGGVIIVKSVVYMTRDLNRNTGN